MKISGLRLRKRDLPVSLVRQIMARMNFFDSATFAISPSGKGQLLNLQSWLKKKEGYQSRLEMLRNSQLDQPCVIIGNGPSLKNTPLNKFQDIISMGSNGLYTIFEKLGFQTDYIFFEDRIQTYLRRKEISQINGSMKMIALSMAYCVQHDKNTLFFNERFPSTKIRPFTPRFSREFSSVAYLGGTVTFVMLQWAYFLGCNPVYIVGVDHNYGELPRILPPGKIRITEEIMEIIKGVHMRPDYYKIGDELGVPDVDFQEHSYSLADKTFRQEGREIINVGLNSSLSVFKKADLFSIF